MLLLKMVDIVASVLSEQGGVRMTGGGFGGCVVILMKQ
ncbi:galactokinase [Providencia burhodogranariea DSM 19968]|uniref:Galactokinase n=1 Tax=Providencia burhodogranariea DSM 19968 TaxID=1141662 RepID=K8WVZ1_9GAMM|nr:galactokinase [Providencia burhodogranariea DSM 19968]